MKEPLLTEEQQEEEDAPCQLRLKSPRHDLTTKLQKMI